MSPQSFLKLLHNGQPVIAAMIFGPRPGVGHERIARDFLLEGRHTARPCMNTIRLRWPRRRRLARRRNGKRACNNGSAVVKMWSNAGLNCATADGKSFYTRTQRTCRRRKIFPAHGVNFPSNRVRHLRHSGKINFVDRPCHDGVRTFPARFAYEKRLRWRRALETAARTLARSWSGEKFAEVSLNGQNLAVLWKPPFRVNVTTAAKPA